MAKSGHPASEPHASPRSQVGGRMSIAQPVTLNRSFRPSSSSSFSLSEFLWCAHAGSHVSGVMIPSAGAQRFRFSLSSLPDAA
eukprot:6685590-Pyramimonas_sp.AAC.1